MTRETHYVTSAGETVPVLLSCTAFEAPRGDRQFVCIGTDITDLKAAQREIKKSHERLQEISQNVQDAIWMVRPNLEECIVLNDRFAQLWGVPNKAVFQDPSTFLEPIHPDDREAVRKSLLQPPPDGSGEVEFRIGSEDEEHPTWLWARSASITNEKGEVVRITGSATDITRRKELEDQLRHQALHDDLTGLPNRRLLQERLQTDLAQLERKPEAQLGVFFVDLDQFKEVNDTFGHRVGDRVLGEIATRLKNTFRPGDLVSRFGGDEFVIVIDEIADERHATSLIERIEGIFDDPIETEEEHFSIGGSIGVVLADAEYGGEHTDRSQKVDALIRDADIAMFEAKEDEHQNYKFFTDVMHESITSFFTQKRELRDALDQQQFQVWFQPVVELATERIGGLEALIRWEHPDRGIVPPGDFLNVAEKAHVVQEMDRWVLKRTIQTIQGWEQVRSEGPFPWVSVNFSARHFFRSDLPDAIDSILKGADINSHRLCFEILETTAMEYSQATADNLQHLSNAGLLLVLDDFGTGFSSLQQFHKLPIDGIKIDQSFVAGLGEDPTARKIVDTALKLGEDLPLETVAEGVETARQADILGTMGCPYAQGFYYYRPMPREDVIEVL